MADNDDIRISTLWVGDTELVVVSVPKPDPANLEILTAAEAEVATLALQGLSNFGIAMERGTSERTVANQLASIYAKLRVNSRAELLAALVETDVAH